MPPPQKTGLLHRCWRRLAPWLPERLRAIVRAALGASPMPPHTLALQLDAMLRELRRLHARIDDLQAALEERTPQSSAVLVHRPWSGRGRAA